uniref:Tetraspanin n=1 Tax=Scleropages formosus TaxID=113540 RepID=A0A8C9SHL1_SCLFO
MARIEKLYHCLRVLMMALCGIIFLSGFAFLGFGAWMKHDSFYYAKVTGLFFEHLVNLAYICLGMGALLCLVGITGFCAAMKENWCLITLVSVHMLFCTKIFGTIFVFAYRDLSVVIVRDVGKKSLQTAYMGPAATDPVSTVWNTIITTYECCGFENSIVDFEKSVFSTTTGLKYPKICCVDKNSNKCNGTNTAEGLVYPESCFGKLTDGIQEKFFVIGSTTAAICVAEVRVWYMCSACPWSLEISSLFATIISE